VYKLPKMTEIEAIRAYRPVAGPECLGDFEAAAPEILGEGAWAFVGGRAFKYS
jgi:hypothetical protein